MGMGSRSIKLARKHGTAKPRASSGRKSKEDKLMHRRSGRKGGTGRGKDPTFVLLDERSPAGVEERDGAELPPERRRLECSHPRSRLAAEAVVMAAGRGGGREGGERRWRPSLRPKRKLCCRRRLTERDCASRFIYIIRGQRRGCVGKAEEIRRRDGNLRVLWSMDAATNGRKRKKKADAARPPARSRRGILYCSPQSWTDWDNSPGVRAPSTSAPLPGASRCAPRSPASASVS